MTWEQIGVILGALAALTVIHAYFVVPRIMLDCRKEWKQDITETHKIVCDRLEKVEDKIDMIHGWCKGR